MMFTEWELKKMFYSDNQDEKTYTLKECLNYLYRSCGIRDIKTGYVYFCWTNDKFVRVKPNLKHSFVKRIPEKSKFVLVNTQKKNTLWISFDVCESIVQGIRNYQINKNKKPEYSNYCCFVCKTDNVNGTNSTIEIINPEPVRMLSELATAFHKGRMKRMEGKKSND